jgi:hypothetical protein
LSNPSCPITRWPSAICRADRSTPTNPAADDPLAAAALGATSADPAAAAAAFARAAALGLETPAVRLGEAAALDRFGRRDDAVAVARYALRLAAAADPHHADVALPPADLLRVAWEDGG